MSKGIIRITNAVGTLGTTFGLALVVVSLTAFFVAGASGGAAFFLIFTAIGAVLLLSGLIVLVSAYQIKKERPAIAAAVLVGTAIIGGNLSFPIIITFILFLLGVMSAIKAVREFQMKRNPKV